MLLLRYCIEDSLIKDLVKGKIVLCDENVGPEHVGFLSGAAGMIRGATSSKDTSMTYAIPAAFLSFRNYRRILSYLNSTRYRCIVQ